MTLSIKQTAPTEKTSITFPWEAQLPQQIAVKNDDIAGIATYKGYNTEYCDKEKLQSKAITAGTKNANDNQIDTEFRWTRPLVINTNPTYPSNEPTIISENCTLITLVNTKT